jgi:membrane-bound lytic murein transglycosylase D
MNIFLLIFYTFLILNHNSSFANNNPTNFFENAQGITIIVDENLSSDRSLGKNVSKNKGNIWVKLNNGFQIEDKNSKRVNKYIKWYQSRPDYVERMIERSSKYIYHVSKEVEKRNMPMEIALLPMIESAYNPIAKSRKKAVGMWQFIPSTGKLYGLKQDWWRDERRNVIDATNAALNYLEMLHDLFGSWELALAAYNAGEGRVKRAIKRNKKKKLPTDYYSLRLPKETKNYIPKLLAVKAIVKNPEKYQLTIKDIPDAPYFSVVNISDEMDTHVAAELAEISYEEFQLLNAEHNRPLMKAQYGIQDILLPIKNIEIFHKNIKNNTQPLSNWISYMPTKGEKVMHVAKKFNIDMKELVKINQLRSNQTLKKQIILIPSSPEVLKKYPISTDNLYSYSKIITHKIKSGDTLGSISRKYKISVKDIMEFNELRNTKIILGKYLDIPK